ncbi:MAG: hypothetical protein CMN30_11820 [Sandaracinus sp.]|nr:hypothetical protein [Sandaracinus sp.]
MRRFPLLALSLLAGCASAIPSWEGGSTAPEHRTDLAAGGAVRVPVANMRDRGPAESAYREVAESGGMVPVAMARYGVAENYDVGLMVAGPLVRLDLRREVVTSLGTTRKAFVFALSPFAGAIPDQGDLGSGVRFGGEARAVYGADVGGLYDAWVGVRLGVEHARGDLRLGDDFALATGTALRAGAVLGMAAGFRRVHAFVEVTAWAEGWFAQHGDLDLDRFGLVLTPSFGLRIRI